MMPWSVWKDFKLIQAGISNAEILNLSLWRRYENLAEYAIKYLMFSVEIQGTASDLTCPNLSASIRSRSRATGGADWFKDNTSKADPSYCAVLPFKFKRKGGVPRSLKYLDYCIINSAAGFTMKFTDCLTCRVSDCQREIPVLLDYFQGAVRASMASPQKYWCGGTPL